MDRERIDDLQINNLKIIQNPDFFCFGIDAVLLANFVKSVKRSHILDIGTGTGIIPLLLTAKINVSRIDAVEIQEDVSKMASRSIILNNLQDIIHIINGDIRRCRDFLNPAKYDIVVSNPPYAKMGSGKINPAEAIALSRHEIACTIDDILDAANYTLKSNGSLYMIHRADRLADVLCGMREKGIEPKNIRLVYPKINKPANLFLIRGIKGGNRELKHDTPLIVYNEDGTYTDEIENVYNDGRQE